MNRKCFSGEITMMEGSQPIPLVGLGTWSLRGKLCVDMVEQALRLGYRHIDTAESYENEREVGDGLHLSGVQRCEIFVTTKVSPSHFSPSKLVQAAKESLARLRLSEVDLLLLHWPNPEIPLAETLGALCDVKRSGLTRNIGVSNFSAADIQLAVRHATEPLVCNQIEMNPFHVRPKLNAACQARGLAIVAYSPLARGEVNSDNLLARIGRAYGKSGAQVSLRWLVQQGIPVIPRTSRIDRLAENLAIFDFALSEVELSKIALIAQRRSQVATVLSPLRGVILAKFPEPAKSVLRSSYRKLRRIIS